MRVRNIIIAPPSARHVTAAPKWLDYLSRKKNVSPGLLEGREYIPTQAKGKMNYRIMKFRYVFDNINVPRGQRRRE